MQSAKTCQMSFAAASYFAGKCLILHRHLPPGNTLANRFWQEICHNLVWLLECAARPEGSEFEAIEWYQQMLIGVSADHIPCAEPSAKKKAAAQQEAFAAVSFAVVRTFGGWAQLADLLTNRIAARAVAGSEALSCEELG